MSTDSMTNDSPIPEPGEVAVTMLDTQERAGLARQRGLLDQQDNQLLAGFRNQDKQEEFILSRALLRTTLAPCVGVAPEKLRFVIGEHGKPSLAPEMAGPWQFNLSHTEGLIVCGVTQDAAIGVDIESHGRRGTLLDIASRFFAPAELEELFSHPLAKQREHFFVYWTLKEAWLKARGTGMTLPLRGFAIDLLRRGGPIGIRFTPIIDDDAGCWSFGSVKPTPRHRLGIALQRPGGFALSLRRVAG